MTNFAMLTKENIDETSLIVMQLLYIAHRMLSYDDKHNISALVNYMVTSKQNNIPAITKIVNIVATNIDQRNDSPSHPCLHINIVMLDESEKEIAGSVQLSTTASGIISTVVW